MSRKNDPFAKLRAMGVTMSEARPSETPVRPKTRRKATPKAVVDAVRSALQQYQGLSAATIAWVLVPELADYAEGSVHGSLGNHPSDPDDFSRCRRIVALVPGGAKRMGEVAAAFPRSRAWARLAPAWAELEALFVEESRRPDRMAPKLYARMSELVR